MQATPCGVEVLAFGAGGARRAVPIACVQEVVRAVALTDLPGAPPLVEGAFSLRGTIVPVISLRGPGGAARQAPAVTDHFIIASTGARLLALRADDALDVLVIDAAALAAARDVAASLPGIAGVAGMPDGLIVLHDPGAFLQAAEAIQLDEALGTRRDTADEPAG